MPKYRVLFVCIHNSARSQMAEGYLRHLGDEFFDVESAGLEAGTLNPYAVKIMQEDGVDISQHITKEIFDLFKEGRFYNAVIAVCDAKAAESCPVFPGVIKREVWSFSDPSSFTGTEEEIVDQIRVVRDEIKEAINSLIEKAQKPNYWIQS